MYEADRSVSVVSFITSSMGKIPSTKSPNVNKYLVKDIIYNAEREIESLG
jgi:hypothetical protein